MKKLVATFIILLSLFALTAEENKTENELEKQAADNSYYQLDTKYFEIIFQQRRYSRGCMWCRWCLPYCPYRRS